MLGENGKIRYLKRLFGVAVGKVWKSFPDGVKFGFEVSQRPKVVASLFYSSDARPRAIGDRIIVIPTKMILVVKPEFFSLSKGKQLKILMHEAGHMGYSRHDEGFNSLMRERGGVSTLSQMGGGGFKAQVKQGSRYITLKSFSNIKEARSYLRSVRDSGDVRPLRIQY